MVKLLWLRFPTAANFPDDLAPIEWEVDLFNSLALWFAAAVAAAAVAATGSSGAREVLELLGGLDEEAAGRHLDAHLRAVLEPHEQARVPGGGEKG